MRCIASDVDGTLLMEGTKDLNPEYFDVIKECKEKGIVFVLASGRQYLSMSRVFQPVIQDVIFICDNGAYVSYQEKTLRVHSIDYDLMVEIVTYLRSVPDIYFQISTPFDAYSESKDEELMEVFEKGYQIQIQRMKDMTVVKAPIVKIAVYNKTQDASVLAEKVKEIFSDRVDVVVSGKFWFDFVAKDISKGSSLQEILDSYSIDKEDVVAFGDNDNDISMLEKAGHSYAVSSARESVKQITRYVLDPIEDAVLKKIQEMI